MSEAGLGLAVHLRKVQGVSVKSFGAVGDGVTNDTAAFTRAFAAGFPIVTVPDGTYLATGLTIPSGTQLIGQSQAKTIIKKSGTLANHLVLVAAGATNWAIKNLTLDGASGAENFSLMGLATSSHNGLISRVTFNNGLNRWALRSDWAAAVDNIEISDCVFYNCPQGGVLFQNSVTGSTNIRILRNTWDSVGHNLCQLSNVTAANSNWWTGVQFKDNVIKNCLSTGANGPIPVEHWGCTDYEASGNIISSGTRGLSCGYSMSRGKIFNNLVSNQTFYGMEGSRCSNVDIHNNTFVNCYSGLKWTETQTITNVRIYGNTFIGTGLAAYNSGTPDHGIYFPAAIAAGLYIENNAFIDLEYVRAAVRVDATFAGNGSLVRVLNNQFIARTYNSFAQGITVTGDNVVVRGNDLLRTADFDNSHYIQSAGANFIRFPAGYTSSGPTQEISDNRIKMSGANTATYLGGIGANVGASTYYGTTVRRNTLIGAFTTVINLPSTAGDTVAEDNNIDGVTAGTLYSLNAAVVYRSTVRQFSGTAAPTAGTFKVGDIYWNSAPAVGQPQGWQCTVAGTPGTWVSMGNL